MGEATEEERAALTRWRAARPANDAEFRRQQAAWKRLGEIAGDAASDSTSPMDERLPPAGRHPSTEGRRPSTAVRTHPRRLLGVVSLAAAVLVTIVAIRPLPFGPARTPLGAEDVVTGPNEVVTLTLRDGTVVRLGPESRLSFSAAEGPRDVLLEGKAYFAVPRMQKDPFRVHTQGGDVKVLGTRFEVQARGAEVQIVVVEGEVEAGAPDNRVSIRRGQMGRLDEATAPVLEPVDNVYLATAWIGEFIAFESTPLRDVVSELEARFELRIEIGDEALASRTVSGMFINQTPAEMIANICLAVDAQCGWSGEIFRMWLPQTVSEPPAALPVEEEERSEHALNAGRVMYASI